MVPLLWKIAWPFLRVKHTIILCPAIPLLGAYLRELKTGFRLNSYTWMLIAAVFT